MDGRRRPCPLCPPPRPVPPRRWCLARAAGERVWDAPPPPIHVPPSRGGSRSWSVSVRARRVRAGRGARARRGVGGSEGGETGGGGIGLVRGRGREPAAGTRREGARGRNGGIRARRRSARGGREEGAHVSGGPGREGQTSAGSEDGVGVVSAATGRADDPPRLPPPDAATCMCAGRVAG